MCLVGAASLALGVGCARIVGIHDREIGEPEIGVGPTGADADAELAGDATTAGDAGGVGASIGDDASDGGTGTGDDAPDDASTDGASLDAGDGGPALGFCASQTGARFCDDFDGLPFDRVWSAITHTNGELTVDTSDSVSPTASALLTVGPLGQAEMNAALRKHIPYTNTLASGRYDFYVKPVQIDPVNSAAIVFGTVVLSNGTRESYALELTLVQQNGVATVGFGELSTFADGGWQYIDHPLPHPLVKDVWTQVSIAWSDLGGSSPHARAFMKGALESDFAIRVPITPTDLELTIGTGYVSEPTSGWKLRFDNVVLRAP